MTIALPGAVPSMSRNRKAAPISTTDLIPPRAAPPVCASAEGMRRRGALLCCALLALPVWAAGRLVAQHPMSDLPVGAALIALWAGASALMILTLPFHPHPRFGPANAVTALRAAGTVALAGFALEPAAFEAWRWPVVVSALAILALDGLDGALARRTGCASAYGARLDMEVDAALTLALAGLALRAGQAGPEILALVLPYYLFSMLRPAHPWLAGPLRPSLLRKAVCVVQVATPLVVLALPLPDPAARLLVSAVLVAILGSFARDIRHLRVQHW